MVILTGRGDCELTELASQLESLRIPKCDDSLTFGGCMIVPGVVTGFSTIFVNLCEPLLTFAPRWFGGHRCNASRLLATEKSSSALCLTRFTLDNAVPLVSS